MKKKVLLSSILTIALCLCLIAGSTFALFTHTSEVSIVATAGDVKMEADITNFELYSVKPSNSINGTIQDENNRWYVWDGPLANFANGGTASFDNSVLTLTNITPGDKVEFNVAGTNQSTVDILYRYVIECVKGEDLMKGLVVYVNGATNGYHALKSYTSVWTALKPGESLDNLPIVIELPVKAGNEYEAKAVEISIRLEAYQGNANLAGIEEPVVELLDGTYSFGEVEVNDSIFVSENGDITLNDTTIKADAVGIENVGGKLVVNDLTMAAGSLVDYAGITRGGTSEYNNADITSFGGGVAADEGATVDFNSGKIYIDSTSTSGRYHFYVVGEGTVVNVREGNFSFNTAKNNKRAYAYVGAGATLNIYGGTFGKASTRSGYTAGLLTENADATINIYGGIFGFDPTQWVATGYTATKVGSQWVVLPETTGAAVNTADDFKAALDAGKTEIVVLNATFDTNALQNGHYNIDKDVTFIGCTFTAKNDWNYIRNATYINCTFDVGSENAAIHFDELHGDLVVTNCNFVSGKVQIGTNGSATATFTGCTFGETTTTSIWAEKGMRFYAPTTFVDCEFNNRVVLAGSNGLELTFTNCTMENGNPVYYVDNTDGIIRGGNIPTIIIK